MFFEGWDLVIDVVFYIKKDSYPSKRITVFDK
jgi:hypothetical protein